MSGCTEAGKGDHQHGACPPQLLLELPGHLQRILRHDAKTCTVSWWLMVAWPQRIPVLRRNPDVSAPIMRHTSRDCLPLAPAGDSCHRGSTWRIMNRMRCSQSAFRGDASLCSHRCKTVSGC